MIWCGRWFGSRPKRINKVWNKVFFGAGADSFFLVFDDNFVVGDFDNFGAGNDELGVEEAFSDGAFDNKLLDAEIVACNCVV